MFPGYLSDSQLLQDIRENYRPQTLVSVPGFTAKHHMFVQPLASRRAASPSLSTQAPHALALPASSQSRQESASSSSTTSHGADETATARFVPSWVTYHGVVRSGFEFLWLCFWSSIEPRRSLLNHPPDFPILFHPSIHPSILSFCHLPRLTSPSVRQVLSFRAVRVPVGEDVTVLYHLSDGTYEVKKDGRVFLKRPIGASSSAVSARVAEETAPDPCTLEIGDELRLSGHVFRLVDADEFTRRHVEAARNGVPLGPPAESAATDSGFRQASDVAPESKRGRLNASDESNRRLTTYLSRGEDLKAALRRGAPAAWRGVVLQAWAVESHTKLDRYLISFHLEDASVELRLIDPNNERKGALVLSRTTLVDPLAAMLGESTGPVGRVFQPMNFLVGSSMKLCGRDLLVTKLCGASAAWMAENIDGVDPNRLHGEISVDTGRARRKPEAKPDDGAEEPPPLPPGLEVLQFLAVGGATVGDGRERVVIRVYCADSSISIAMADRGTRYLRPGHYGVNVARDLFIGAKVTINRHQFEIIDASRATLLYVASHPEVFESSRADDALILRVQESLFLDTSDTSTHASTAVATIDDLAAVEGLRGVPKAKLISAAVLLGTSADEKTSKLN